MGKYDAVIIGAGHNGLVAACYLAKAGWKVLVLERRELVGGCAITEEVIPGYRFSRLAYVNSLFRPELIRELRLRDYGFEMLPREPSSFTPFPGGGHLFLGSDAELNRREISKFSRRDADAYERYEAMLGRMVEVLEPTLDRPPPDPLAGISRPGELFNLARLGLGARRLGKELYPFLAMLTGSAARLLDEWFESEELKVTLATDAIIGAMASPKTPGTAYVLFHHVMGETDGARGVWGYVRGGMGALSEAIASRARDLGVEIRTGCGVESIIVEDGKAAGVRTRDSKVELTSPPIMTMAMGCRISFPGAPPAKAKGTRAKAAVRAVMRMGATRSAVPRKISSRPKGMPSSWERLW